MRAQVQALVDELRETVQAQDAMVLSQQEAIGAQQRKARDSSDASAKLCSNLRFLSLRF